MQITTNNVSAHTIEITIKENQKEMEKYQRKAAAEIAKDRQFKGFKKGSTDVPVDVVAAEVGPGYLESEALQKALESLYPKALKKAEVSPVDQGEIKEITSVMPLEVTLSIEILPEIKVDLKKAKKVSVEKKPVKVSAADVKKDMEEIEKKQITYAEQKKKDAIKDDDQITIHASGYDKKGGTQDDRLSLHDFAFVVGGGMMIPGFEDHFIGKKVGDDVDFEITFPKDYHSEDFAGNKVYFECHIVKIENAVKPEWTPEFINSIWGKELSLEDFKKELKDAILKDRETAEQQRVEDAIYDELIELSTIEVGPRLLARETDQVYAQHAQDIQRRGMDPDAYLQHLQTDKETFMKQQLEPLALRRVQAQLILEHLRKNLDDIEVADKEVEKETKSMFEQYADNEDFMKRVKEMYAPGNEQFEELRARLQYKNIIEKFIKEPSSEPKKKA